MQNKYIKDADTAKEIMIQLHNLNVKEDAPNKNI
jgi:hypothetical protein